MLGLNMKTPMLGYFKLEGNYFVKTSVWKLTDIQAALHCYKLYKNQWLIKAPHVASWYYENTKVSRRY
jgi:hypothetical protein